MIKARETNCFLDCLLIPDAIINSTVKALTVATRFLTANKMNSTELK